MIFKKHLEKFALFLFFVSILLFYSPLILKGLLPIPSDTIVGLYHPFRDLFAESFPQGIPFKNFLITDPVRQTFIWKDLVIDQFKSGSLPLWNPYEMSGKPLLGNLQSAPLYPLNLVLFINPFYASWSFFILLQTVLGGLFMFFYLKNLKLSPLSSLIGMLAFSFSGFSISWLEWGNVVHTALWLPLILLSIDKIMRVVKRESITGRKTVTWSLVLLFAAVSSFLAGHLQTFFYILVLSSLYFVFRWVQYGKNIKVVFILFVSLGLFFIITFIQWYQVFVFILNSSRSVDQSYLNSTGWFVPVQNLIQFIAPDFFGNPTTLNYWGVWNYAEFVGYIGAIPLLFAFIALICVRRKIVYFFLIMVLVSLIFMTQNFISILPYKFAILFFSTAQPTRLVFLVVFSLCVLASFGFHYLESLRQKKSKVIISALVVMFLYGVVWLLLMGNVIAANDMEKHVALRNLLLPTVLVVFGSVVIFLLLFIRNTFIRGALITVLLIVIVFDLTRFANKFTPFTQKSYLFPNTAVTEYLQKKSQDGLFRIAALNDEILPPNFSTYYKIQNISGYDPLYLSSYAEFIAALERGKPDISPPFGYNRIITPKNYASDLFNLLNVRYILTFDEIRNPKFNLVLEEGRTKVYENKQSLPRAFFVEHIIIENDEQNHIRAVFDNDLSNTAIVFSEKNESAQQYSVGEVIIKKYSPEEIVIETKNEKDGFLVLTDAFYPLWSAEIDGKGVEIIRTDYAFRGLFVPSGKHTIIFKMNII